MRQRLEYALVWLIVKSLGSLPRPLARAAAISLAWIIYFLHVRLRQVGFRNLALAFPEKSLRERARILRIAQTHAAVKNVHDLKTRMAGLSTFIQLHLALDPKMSLAEAHTISDAVEQALLEAYPGAEVIIHQDPAGLEPLPDQPD